MEPGSLDGRKKDELTLFSNGPDESEKNGLFHMEPILGLFKDDGMRSFNHFIGNFFASPRGKTMQDESVGFGVGQ